MPVIKLRIFGSLRISTLISTFSPYFARLSDLSRKIIRVSLDVYARRNASSSSAGNPWATSASHFSANAGASLRQR